MLIILLIVASKCSKTILFLSVTTLSDRKRKFSYFIHSPTYLVYIIGFYPYYFLSYRLQSTLKETNKSILNHNNHTLFSNNTNLFILLYFIYI